MQIIVGLKCKEVSEKRMPSFFVVPFVYYLFFVS